MRHFFNRFATVLTLRALIAVSLVSGLGACNTMEGLGKDLKQAGQSLETAAEPKKK